jgi:hypothetical protein
LAVTSTPETQHLIEDYVRFFSFSPIFYFKNIFAKKFGENIGAFCPK